MKNARWLILISMILIASAIQLGAIIPVETASANPEFILP